jgi:internalin A
LNSKLNVEITDSQKHIHLQLFHKKEGKESVMKKKLLLISFLTTLTLASSVQARGGQVAPKSFGDWCTSRAKISKEAEKTVQAVLDELGTEDCQIAGSKANGLQELRLNSSGIKDLTPLIDLVNLTVLSLEDNRIEDITPLSNLTRVRKLNLRSNKIIDIAPLSNLTSLQILKLDRNKISNISQLKTVDGIEQLSLGHNKIDDLTPLFDLSKLSSLRFVENSVRNKDVKGLGDLLIQDNIGIELGDNPNSAKSSPLKADNELSHSLNGTLEELPTSNTTLVTTSYSVYTIFASLAGMMIGVFVVLTRIIPKIYNAENKSKSHKVNRKHSKFIEAFEASSYLEKEWLVLAKSLDDLGFYQEAIEILDRYVAEYPNKEEAWDERGKVLTKLLRPEDALQSYQTALAIKSLNSHEGNEQDMDTKA